MSKLNKDEILKIITKETGQQVSFYDKWNKEQLKQRVEALYME